MTESTYHNDVQFAGLVQAATAAADERTKISSGIRKRKRNENDFNFETDGNAIPTEAEAITNADSEPKFQDSAAVLFRTPSIKSTKYSRPPLGTVYASLELAPESFLRLQAAAKEFMLDPTHPERKDAVGHKKHSTGTDVAKLKLWNCVEEFLTYNDNGKKFFGSTGHEGNSETPKRTIFWPRDRPRIIKLLMPLMRKMVTNERQRIYAAETRKSGQTKETQPQPSVMNESMSNERNSSIDSPHHESRNDQDAPSPVPASRPNHTVGPDSQTEELVDKPIFQESTLLFVNLVTNESGKHKRLMSCFTLPVNEAPNLSMLLNAVRTKFKALSRKKNDKNVDLDSARIRVWLADGLVQVNDDGEWMIAILSASTVEWMDRQIRVLVEC